MVALSPKTFEILWKRNFKERIAKRGFVYSKNENNNQGYIFINSGINLYKLEADSGKLELEFGNNGFVETGEVEIPGVLYEDSIIVSNTSERKILSINKNNGKVNFSKDIHPDENYFYSNPWGGAALDDEIG